MTEEHNDQNQLLLGIDLGTSRTAVMSSKGYKSITRSVVGYPKDIIGVKLLGNTQIFGDDALSNRSALSLYYPLENGVIRDTSDQDYNSAYELLRHVVEEAKQDFDGEVCGIIGVPARATMMNKESLLRIAKDILDVALIVSEPFMVAYHLEKLNNCVIVDIGAGTTDICGMKGTIPAPEDQTTIVKGGNYLDERLESAISQKYPLVQMTRNIARVVKEEHSFVGNSAKPVLITLRSEGKPSQYDVTQEIRLVCESIVPDIAEHLVTIIAGFDPENQQEALQNIFLAGGGSQIRNLDKMIQEKLGEYGAARVTHVDDPDFAGSSGALKMAQDLPPAYWDKIGFTNSRRQTL